MPFVKRDVTAPSKERRPTDDTVASHVAALSSPDSETRWSAARALGGRADAVPALAAALAPEPVARVREAIMTALMRVGDEASVMALLPYLRSQDAALRGASHRGAAGLAGSDPAVHDVAAGATAIPTCGILATELARNMPAADATRLLCRLLEHEQHPNVCAAAIDVLAEVGTREAVPALQSCAERFAGTPFLPFAASTAIARISNAERLGPEWQVRRLTARVPSASPRRTFGACANSSIAGPECCSPTTSAITSIAASPSELRRPDRARSRPISPSCAPTPTTRSNISINAFTVNETYFYREEHQLRCMTSDLLGDVIRRKPAGRSDPHLVGSLLDRRGALFDRHLADGELEPRSTATTSRSSARTSTPARSRPRPRASMANAPSCGCRGT